MVLLMLPTGGCLAGRRLLSVPSEWQGKAWELGEPLHQLSKGHQQIIGPQPIADFHAGTALRMTTMAGQTLCDCKTA